MSAENRVSTVAEFGFTPRQARFLVMVMRHADVCLLRQYSAFAGIVHGQKTRAFFRSSSAVGTHQCTSVGTIARASTTSTTTRCTRPSVNPIAAIAGPCPPGASPSA